MSVKFIKVIFRFWFIAVDLVHFYHKKNYFPAYVFQFTRWFALIIHFGGRRKYP